MFSTIIGITLLYYLKSFECAALHFKSLLRLSSPNNNLLTIHTPPKTDVVSS
ncbi:hypothetical protein C5S39_13770 [Candidatus Methanophagaceae archaeon]|nr:hypothetical protein C5S39_13770 [Methanophagales archaeon]